MAKITGRNGIIYISTEGGPIGPFRLEPKPMAVRYSGSPGVLYNYGWGAWSPGPAPGSYTEHDQSDHWDRSQVCNYCTRRSFVKIGEPLRDQCPGCGGNYQGRGW